MKPVRDLASSAAALKVIVEQGEGARDSSEDSHHARFLAIQEEYEEIQRDDPKFEPGRPVMRNPYSTLPNDIADNTEVNLIEDPLSIDISNLFDGCYELLMQMLGRLFLHMGESETQLTRLSDITVGLMTDVIGPLGEALTTLPAGPSHPGTNGRSEFSGFSRDVQTPPHQAAGLGIVHRAVKRNCPHIVVFSQTEGIMSSVLPRVRASLAQYAEQLSES